MAKIKLAFPFAEISGTLGNTVFKKSKRGEAIIAHRPRKSAAEPSAAQQANRERFKLAAAYATAALANPALRVHYEQLARKRHTTPHLAARSDYYKGIDLLTK